ILSDQALLERMRAEDQAAFKVLYKRYWKRCYLQVIRRTGDLALAEDLTQGVFVSLWENRKSAVIKDLASYLFTAVRFQFITYLKSQMREHAYVTDFLQRHSSSDNPVERAFRIKELNEAIDKGVAMMPAKTKTIYTL